MANNSSVTGVPPHVASLPLGGLAMIRRLFWMGGSAALLMGWFLGRDAVSYMTTSAGWVKDSVKHSIPVGFEIDRARTMIRDLTPDVRRGYHVIAQEEVQVERLEKQIAQAETNLVKERDEILRLKNDLATGQNVFHYANRTYTADQVKTDLANRFARFKTNEATLGTLRDQLQARQRTLDASRNKLEGILAMKRQLEVEVENLEAKSKVIEVAQTTSQYNFDDSNLGHLKELMADIRTRLSVEEKLVCAENQYQGEIQISVPTSENILDQVSEYFGAAGPKVATIHP